MDERIKFLIGLDAPKLAGTIGSHARVLLKVLASAGDPTQVSVVYEADPHRLRVVPRAAPAGISMRGRGAAADKGPCVGRVAPFESHEGSTLQMSSARLSRRRLVSMAPS